jgi:hypothetical protein
MQFNTHCALCADRVTRVFTEDEAVVLIDPDPHPETGYIYVIGRSPLGAVVKVTGGPDEVPGNEPLRYVHHACT